MIKKKLFKERRAVERYSCCLAAEYSILGKPTKGICRIRDISIHGAGLVIARPLVFGTCLLIKVVDRRMHFVTFVGEVRWCKREGGGWRAGVLFDDPSSFPLEAV